MGAIQSTERSIVHETPKGKLKGIQKIDNGTQKPVYNRFTAVPYALPPVGDRRWRRPVKLPADYSFNGSNGEAGDYTKFPSTCPQPLYAHGAVELPNEKAAPAPETTQNEDCLYVNIWVPAQDPPVGGWPVQFYIHGGWLQMGDANHANKHDPFYLMQEYPRIIVAVAYRLNLFGFMSCSELQQEDTTHAPGNYGFWDQRAALEWTHANVSHFGGNPDNISVGGLSAGAYSTIFQLNYDIRLPKRDRLIKRVYLYSNAVGIQPNSVTSPDYQTQADELCTAVGISTSLSASEKLAALRKVSSEKLAETIHSLNQHTFRAGTDDDFIASDFLSKIVSGNFGDWLAAQGVDVMLGEVADEATLYRLVNPATSYDSLILQLNNYYPKAATEALVKLYPLPGKDAGKDEWADIGSIIIGDCQVHATIRGFTKALLQKMPQDRVYRYRISWRAKALDDWLDPSVRMCHASDIPVWWATGQRAGFEKADVELVTAWLKPQYEFLKGEKPEWGTKDIKQIRELTKDGRIELVEDKLWDSGIKTWDTMIKAQLS